MPELITRDTLGPALEELRLAFRIRLVEKDVDGTLGVWQRALEGLPVEAVQTAVRQHIRAGEHFPRIKEIVDRAKEFLARTTGATMVRVQANPYQCAICGAKYEYHEVDTRQVVIVKLVTGQTRYIDRFKPDGSPALDGKGEPIWIRIVSPRADIYHDPVAHGLVRPLSA